MTLEELKKLWQERKGAIKAISELERNLRIRKKQIVLLDEKISRILKD